MVSSIESSQGIATHTVRKSVGAPPTKRAPRKSPSNVFNPELAKRIFVDHANAHIGAFHNYHAASPNLEIYYASGGQDYEADFPFFKIVAP